MIQLNDVYIRYSLQDRKTWVAAMGNQTTKVTSVTKNNKYGDQNDNEKKSRTNWTAGKHPAEVPDNNLTCLISLNRHKSP